MGILNLTPDSFRASSRVSAADFAARAGAMLRSGADIIDVGAVSSRPGAAPVSEEEEWGRLNPALRALRSSGVACRLSIDTFRSGIVRRCYDLMGPFIVNDISAGEDDPDMLSVVGELGLTYVAMHKRGNPVTMDSLTDYPRGVVPALLEYFSGFSGKASAAGVLDWILDPGLGFAKTPVQCLEILEGLEELKVFGRPVLVGASHKRFTACGLLMSDGSVLDNDAAERLAIAHGADIIRRHFDICKYFSR